MTSVDTPRNRNKLRFSSSGTIRREDPDNITPSLRHINLQTLNPCSDPPPPEPTPPLMNNHSQGVSTLAFSAVKRLFHTGSEDKTVCVVDSATMELVERPKGHKPILESVAIDESQLGMIDHLTKTPFTSFNWGHYNHHSTPFSIPLDSSHAHLHSISSSPSTLTQSAPSGSLTHESGTPPSSASTTRET
ncbi:hypothetical protein BLNAU_968 [Blattamonas nauphoetae]|uniref:Uncharacterized protein n=1 Tax=Blattamonas nauphoetae TaxID=2049346 RepID=A0ABQ9YJR9_9EUKA|nr:hypothetical protein BLNAU_968 [Blattamonas nauphoetae]